MGDNYFIIIELKYLIKFYQCYSSGTLNVKMSIYCTFILNNKILIHPLNLVLCGILNWFDELCLF